MAANNVKEQTITLARKANGCLLEAASAAGTKASCKIQRLIANVLGRRNEHQRGDRDAYITVANTVKLPVNTEQRHAS